MKLTSINLKSVLLFFLIIIRVHHSNAQTLSYPPKDQVASEFRALLERPHTTPRPDIKSVKTDSVFIEKGFFYSEETEKVPLLIYKPLSSIKKRLPVIICLHGTGGSKDNQDIKALLYRFSRLGFMAVAIDARFHGERATASGNTAYVEAITKAWRNKDAAHQTHPFLYDTVYDLWRLTDYLISREDVDAERIGMTGVSMGGIETWMAASVDKRIKVAVPIIAAQSFKWSLENNRWQGRAGTIKAAHEAAAKDLGDTQVNKENVKTLWNKLLPDIFDKFDCPSMVRLFAPRPLLFLSNADDQNCPLPGAEIAFSSAKDAYATEKAEDKLRIHVSPNEPHRFLKIHGDMACDWFVKWL